MKRFFGTAVVGLIGAILGSFSMMLFASTHFTTSPDPATRRRRQRAPLPVERRQRPRADRQRGQTRRTVGRRASPTVNGTRVVPTDPFFQQFFGGGGGPGIAQPFQARLGLGLRLSQRRLILTNNHVVPKARLEDHGRVRQRRPRAGTRLLVEPRGRPRPSASRQLRANCRRRSNSAISSKLKPGSGRSPSANRSNSSSPVSVGVVSGFNRDEPIQDESGTRDLFRGMLQTSAPINPGNSGGPLVDIQAAHRREPVDGQPAAGAQGIGFAIPSNLVRNVVASLEKNQGKTHQGHRHRLPRRLHGRHQRPRNQINYNGGSGVAVQQVFSGPPGRQAGISPGDVIQKSTTRTYATPRTSSRRHRLKKPGQTVRLQVWTPGTKKLVVITLGEQPAEAYLTAATAAAAARRATALSARQLSPERVGELIYRSSLRARRSL